jgi:integrase
LFAIKKSFDFHEEKKIAKLLFEDVQCTGEKIGLLLMYCLGLRNAESCAVKFGDFHIINTQTGDMNLYIYESVVIDSNELKVGGKTKNMARILPVPSRLSDFICKRKEYVKSILGENENIDSMPLVCSRDNLCKRSKSDNLTAEAHILFKKIGIDEDVLRCIDKDMENGDVGIVLNEKSPTAYLFRRNFATHLHILGLDDAEIRKICGLSHPVRLVIAVGYASEDDKLREKKRKSLDMISSNKY